VAEALELVSRSSGNITIEEAVNKVRKLILEGDNIPAARKRRRYSRR
jgi:type II secretory pathway component PulF